MVLPTSAFTVGDELAALGVADRGGNSDFDAQLVGPMGLAFADAFDFRRVQGIDLRHALMLLLFAHAPRQCQQSCERARRCFRSCGRRRGSRGPPHKQSRARNGWFLSTR
jgi:hypothetical protein